MKRFEQKFDHILNEASCSKALDYLKEVDSFIEKDITFLRNKVHACAKDGVYVDGKGYDRCAIREYLKENIAFTIDYSRKFLILATLNHLDNNRFNLASSYIKTIASFENGGEMCLRIGKDYEHIIKSKKTLVIAEHAENIAKLIDSTKKTCVNLRTIFFNYCYNQSSVQDFVALDQALQKISLTMMNERIAVLKNFIKSESVKFHIDRVVKLIKFHHKIFELYGPNMNKLIFTFGNFRYSIEEAISDVLLELCIAVPSCEFLERLDAMKCVLELPDMRDYYRDHPNKALSTRMLRFMFANYLPKEMKLRYFRFTLHYGLINPQQELTVTNFELKNANLFMDVDIIV